MSLTFLYVLIFLSHIIQIKPGNSMICITKNIFLNTLFCRTFGWRLANGKIPKELSPTTLFRMEEGKEIGRRARAMFPEGVFVRETEYVTAAKRTAECLREHSCRNIFEGAFLFENFITRADILTRATDDYGWDLIEVKSSVNQKAEFIDDMAYTTLIAQEAGFSPNAVKLMLVDRNYRLGMDPQKLFQTVDCTEQVMARVDDFTPYLPLIGSLISQPIEPEPVLSYKCKNCEEFPECTGKDIDCPIFIIPRLQQKKADEMIEQGVVCVQDIPDDFPLSANQKKVVECVKCGLIRVDPVIKDMLQEIQWPAYYLDFETTMTALPLYPGIGPYEKIPTQYSIHFCDQCGCINIHRQYIANPKTDCRREFAERLLEDLAGGGSIITYSSFEKTVIRAVTDSFPDLGEPLRQIMNRIVDLEKFVHRLDHPEFRGRTSIKVVLPVLVPDLSYDGLEIANGDMAMVRFAMMARETIPEHKWEETCVALLEYCKMDTLAMVRLHEALEWMVNSELGDGGER